MSLRVTSRAWHQVRNRSPRQAVQLQAKVWGILQRMLEKWKIVIRAYGQQQKGDVLPPLPFLYHSF